MIYHMDVMKTAISYQYVTDHCIGITACMHKKTDSMELANDLWRVEMKPGWINPHILVR